MTTKNMALKALTTATLLLAGLMAVGCGDPAPDGDTEMRVTTFLHSLSLMFRKSPS